MRAVVAAAALCCCCQAPEPERRGASLTQAAETQGDPGVAALMASDTLVCTATLLSPRVVLTAAHCLSAESPPEVVFGSAPDAGGTRRLLIDLRRHPAFDPFTFTDDIALALLDAPAPPGAVAASLPVMALDDSSVGAALRLVGFGRTAPNDASAPRKRQGTATLSSLAARRFGVTAAPSHTCEGDSGGPAFAVWGGLEALVGVTSSGDPQCAGEAYQTRVDAYRDAFIAPYLRATTDGAAAPGERCFYAGNCGPSAGACAESLDDPMLSFCAPPCGGDGTCPAGLVCQSDPRGLALCRHQVPSPGALGAPCADDLACVDGLCAERADRGPRVCARRCFIDLPSFCPGGYECVASLGRGGGEACFAPRTGGCAFARGGRDSAPWALVIVLLVAGLRRRTGSW